jgi:hypothetical protein
VELVRPDVGKARDSLPYRGVTLKGNPLSAAAKLDMTALAKTISVVVD